MTISGWKENSSFGNPKIQNSRKLGRVIKKWKGVFYYARRNQRPW